MFSPKHGACSSWCDATWCLCQAQAVSSASLCALRCCLAISYQLLWLTLESSVVRKPHLSPVFPIHIQLDYFTSISLRFKVKRGCSVQHLLSLGQTLLPFYVNLSSSQNDGGDKLKDGGRKEGYASTTLHMAQVGQVLQCSSPTCCLLSEEDKRGQKACWLKRETQSLIKCSGRR